ncbi:MAG: tetratricopeptide repeat protein [Candidatus Nealsonbacteria bacterium]|nr:tetratricopeptide repeat protein [Candidatus Nealsonbacteria bacterium]
MMRPSPVSHSTQTAANYRANNRAENRPSSGRATKRALNTPFFIGTLLVAVVLGGSSYGLYCYQSSSVADAVWEHANRLAAEASSLEEKGEHAEAVKEWQKAASYYHRFLRVRPNDVNATIAVAEAYDESAKSRERKERAVEHYYNAMAVAPDDRAGALRTRLAELLMEVGQFGQAEREIEKLLQTDPKNPAAMRLKALARFGVYRYGGTASRGNEGPALNVPFEESLQLNPADVRLATTLALFYRGNKDLLDATKRNCTTEELQQQADSVIDRMVTKNPNSAEAFLARYFYRIRCTVAAAQATVQDAQLALKLAGRDDVDDRKNALADATAALQSARRQADADLQSALKYGPDDVGVRMAAARTACLKAERSGAAKEMASAHYDRACAHYEHVIEVDSSATGAYLALGEVHHIQGRKTLAIKKWRDGLENGRKDRPLVLLNLHSRLVDALIDRNELHKTDNAEGLHETSNALAEFRRAVRNSARGMKKTQKLAFQSTLDLLEGRWHVQKGDPLRAIFPLERAANTTANGVQAFRAWSLLGQVRGELQQWDHAAAACERAVELYPKEVASCLAAARACSRAGRTDAAVRYYQMAEGLANTPETRLALALAHYQRQAGLSPEDRQWDAFDNALADARSGAKDGKLNAPWRLTLLEAGYVATRGKQRGDREQAYAKAAELYREAEKEFPDSLPMLHRLVSGYEQLGQPADADRVLAKVATLTDKPAAAFLMKSQLLAQRKQYKQAQEELAKALKVLPETARFAVRLEQAQLYLRQAQPAKAQKVFSDLYAEQTKRYEDLSKKLASLKKNHKPTLDVERDRATARRKLVEVARQAADVALNVGDFKLVGTWDGRLETHEGLDGSAWRYYRALRLLGQSTKIGDRAFNEASSLRDKLRDLRPDWHATHLVDASIAEARGNRREAIDAYEKAIAAGERRVAIERRVIGLLCQMRRFDEADRHLAKLTGGDDDPATLARLEIVIAEGRDAPERAVKAAQRLVTHRPDDPNSRIVLGHVLMNNDRTDEAESEYKLALKAAPKQLEPYAALFDYYRKTRQLDRAREIIEQLGALEVLGESERALQLAPRYLLLGDDEQAEANYRKAVKVAEAAYRKAGKKATKDSKAHARLVSARAKLAFFLTSARNFDEAEQVLRDLLKLEPNHDAARRRLALVLAVRGGDEQWQQAQEMLKQTDPDDMDEEDRRLHAALLENRGGSDNLESSRRMLEGLIADAATPEPRDRLLLARVYEAENKERAARDQLLALAGGDNPQPQHLVAYVDFLLRKDSAREAGSWIDRLEEVTTSTNWPTVSLRARWLRSQDRADEIEKLVEPAVRELLENFAKDEQRQTQLALAVGDLYSQVELDLLAEGWYRRVYAAVPDNYLPLITSLVRQGRMGEAIEVCKEAAESDSTSRPVVVLARALSQGKPTAEDSQLAEPLLAQALKEHPSDISLLLNLANFRIAQQRIVDAIELYREVLKVDANHLMALNNLATLLSEQPGKCREAMEYIDRAIRVAGEQPGFLDTKGMIYLYDRKPEEALKCLETAVNSPDLDPRYFFHLAVAYQRVGNTDKAREALKKAQDDGLARQILTDRDQEMIDKLKETL